MFPLLMVVQEAIHWIKTSGFNCRMGIGRLGCSIGLDDFVQIETFMSKSKEQKNKKYSV